ncbi:MAG: precorrin-2 C(20)-methyltransferase [Huintestinicola sp.]
MSGMRKGTLYGIGLGPGDPELVTVKAARLIERCSVIALPDSGGENHPALDIVSKLCDLNKKTVTELYLPMTRDNRKLLECRKNAAEKICAVLEKGTDIAFPNIGDVTLYSTFSYIAEIVESMGYETEYVPGIMSCSAAAAALKRPLAKGNEPFVIIPARCKNMEELLKMHGTKAIFKSGKSIAEVMKAVKENSGNAVVGAVENCTLHNERIMYSADEIDESCGYFTVILIDS